MATTRKAASTKTNTLAIFGLILAFFIPLIGLILSIVGLSQINKSRQSGKGLAVAGIVISAVNMLFQLLLVVLIVVAANSAPTLVPYRNNELGYSINYPKDWQVVDESDKSIKGILFKDEVGGTGKVRGQVEVIYTAPPPNGYKTDVLTAIKDSFVASNKVTITSESRQDVKGAKALRFKGTYNVKDGKVAVQGIIMLNKDNSVYTIVAQTPEENISSLQKTFDEIENSFNP
jgi:hypothetical protein